MPSTKASGTWWRSFSETNGGSRELFSAGRRLFFKEKGVFTVKTFVSVIALAFFAGFFGMGFGVPARAAQVAQSAPPPPGQGNPNHSHQGRRDDVKRVHRWLKVLEKAHRMLNAENSGDHFGGHRAAADRDIQQAIGELQQALQYVQQNRENH